MGLLSFAGKMYSGYKAASGFANNAISTMTDVFGELVDVFSGEIKDIVINKLKKSVIKNVLSLLLFIGALLISYFKLPTAAAAPYITSVILLTVLGFEIYRAIKLIVKNQVLIFCFIKKKFRIFDTVVLYVKSTKGKAAVTAVKILDFLNKVNKNIQFIKNSTIKRFKRQVVMSALGIVKIMIVDLLFFGGYMIIVSKIVKPMLLSNLTGLSEFQIYIYPFVNAFDFLFHTNISSFFGIGV